MTVVRPLHFLFINYPLHYVNKHIGCSPWPLPKTLSCHFCWGWGWGVIPDFNQWGGTQARLLVSDTEVTTVLRINRKTIRPQNIQKSKITAMGIKEVVLH